MSLPAISWRQRMAWSPPWSCGRAFRRFQWGMKWKRATCLSAERCMWSGTARRSWTLTMFIPMRTSRRGRNTTSHGRSRCLNEWMWKPETYGGGSMQRYFSIPWCWCARSRREPPGRWPWKRISFTYFRISICLSIWAPYRAGKWLLMREITGRMS